MPECLQSREKFTTNNSRPATKKPGQKREREREREGERVVIMSPCGKGKDRRCFSNRERERERERESIMFHCFKTNEGERGC